MLYFLHCNNRVENILSGLFRLGIHLARPHWHKLKRINDDTHIEMGVGNSS